MSNNIEFKRDIDEQIKDNYKIFDGFDKLSNIDYFYYQDLEKTYIDIGNEDVDPQIEKWIFDHFSWFPEGLYGEVIFFERNIYNTPISVGISCNDRNIGIFCPVLDKTSYAGCNAIALIKLI